MAFAPEITAFWQELSEREAELNELPPPDRMEAFNEILERHVSGLAIELSAEAEDGKADLIVTAHGVVDEFPTLLQLVAAAPSLDHHDVVAFRERTDTAGFGMRMDGFELATGDVLMACGVADGRIGLHIRFGREIPMDYKAHARNMVFIMLDHVLGEYDSAVKVGAVDFVDEDDERSFDWTPMDRFPPVFDAFWTGPLGRTGIFPDGEPELSSAELTFSTVDADEEGNETDAEESLGDTGFLVLNRSANAVAMRADLVHALTIDLPAFDADSLAATQDIQEQAATLLEQSRLGILVYTLMRGGRREALYYVGDIVRTQELLTPLLSRVDADSQTPLVEFDPTWSGYFQYAGDEWADDASNDAH